MTAPNNCTLCKLHHQRKAVVNGTGKWFEPKLFIVGEAPGREEDDSGQPFIGGAGRVLNSLLQDAGISRQDCYVTNTVRCRPPNNRVPDLDELVACVGHLTGEVDKIKPRLIVALGDTATTLLTGKAVSTWRGSIVTGIGPALGYDVLITYHPAFVMRQRSIYPVVSWDLRKGANWQGEEDEVTNYLYEPTREDVIRIFKHIVDNNLPTAVDIETAGDKEEGGKDDALNPYKGEMIGIAFAWGKGQAMQLSYAKMVEYWDLVHNFLETHKLQVYANNLFDRFFMAVNKNTHAHNYWDVQSAMHLIYSALPKKLDFLRSIYTTMPPYKQVYKVAAGGKYRPERLSEIDLAKLNCQDVDVTIQVYEAQKNFLPAPHLMQDMQEEEDIALDMKLRGVYIDQNAVATHYATILPQLESLKASFESTYSVSISSPKQLNTLLYDALKLPRFDDTGKSCYSGGSTNEKAIQAIGQALGLVYLNDDDGERFEGEHSNKQVLADILVYRGLAKISSTYCEGLFASIRSDGRVHPGWKPTGTDTGRWSCVDVPMQGVPKDLRNIVRAAPGKILFGADYKGAQIVGAGILAGDWELVELMLKPEYSIHNDVMEAIRPFYPSIKKIQAKTVVFGTFFGRTVRDIARQFHVPIATAQLWQDIFYTQRPKLKVLFEEKLPKEWEAKGYVTTIDGRRKYCERVTEAKNTPVQNFESVLTKSAMRKLKAEGYSLILMGHDQLVCEEPDDDTKEVRYARFVEIMETALPQYYHKFPVDGGMGYTWDEV